MPSLRRVRSSYNMILPRLYLGDLLTASHKPTMTKLAISHLVSIEVKPIVAEEIAKCVKYNLYISAMDHERQDLISHFDIVYKFIHDALSVSSNKVFVHCIAGVSRSATLVTAYIMKSHCLSYRGAYEIVSSRRRVVNPNDGFKDQLRLWQKMRYHVDIGNRDYRLIALESLIYERQVASATLYKPIVWLATRIGPHEQLVPKVIRNTTTAIDHELNTMDSERLEPEGVSVEASCSSENSHDSTESNKSDGSSSSHRSDGSNASDDRDQKKLVDCLEWLIELYFGKLQLMDKKYYPRVYRKSRTYKCKKCHTTLFHSISIVKAPTSISLNIDSSGPDLGAADGHDMSTLSECPYLYVEPQAWMKRTLISRPNGAIHCDYCQCRLGKFDWSCQSSCHCLKHEPIRQVRMLMIHKRRILSSRGLNITS